MWSNAVFDPVMSDETVQIWTLCSIREVYKSVIEKQIYQTYSGKLLLCSTHRYEHDHLDGMMYMFSFHL